VARDVQVTESKLQLLYDRNPGEINFG